LQQNKHDNDDDTMQFRPVYIRKYKYMQKQRRKSLCEGQGVPRTPLCDVVAISADFVRALDPDFVWTVRHLRRWCGGPKSCAHNGRSGSMTVSVNVTSYEQSQESADAKDDHKCRR